MGHCISKYGGSGPGPPVSLEHAAPKPSEASLRPTLSPTQVAVLTIQDIDNADGTGKTRSLCTVLAASRGLTTSLGEQYVVGGVNQATLGLLGLPSAAAYSRFFQDLAASNQNLQAVLRKALQNGSDRQLHSVAIIVPAPPAASSGAGKGGPFLGLVLTPCRWRAAPDSEECLSAVLVEHLPAELPTVIQAPSNGQEAVVQPSQTTQAQHGLAKHQTFEFVLAMANACQNAVAVCSTDGHQVLFQNAASLRYGGDLRTQGQQFDYLQQLLRLHTPDLLNQLLEAVIVQDEPWKQVVQVPPSLVVGRPAGWPVSGCDSIISGRSALAWPESQTKRVAVTPPSPAVSAPSPAVSASIAGLFLSAATTVHAAADDNGDTQYLFGSVISITQGDSSCTLPQPSAAPAVVGKAGKGGDVSGVGLPQQAATRTHASPLGRQGDAGAAKHVQSVGLQHEEAGPTAAAEQAATAGTDDAPTSTQSLPAAAPRVLPPQPRLGNLRSKSSRRLSWEDMMSITGGEHHPASVDLLQRYVATSSSHVAGKQIGRVSPNSAFMMPSSGSSGDERRGTKPKTPSRASLQPALQPVYSADAAPTRAAMMSRARTDLLASADTIHASRSMAFGDAASTSSPRARHRKAVRRSSTAHVQKNGLLESIDIGQMWRASVCEPAAPSPTRARLFSLLNAASTPEAQRSLKGKASEAASKPPIVRSRSSHGRLQAPVPGAPEPSIRLAAEAACPADTLHAPCWPAPQPVVKAVDPPGTAETSLTGAAAEPCWHEVSVVPFTDPDTKNKVLLVCHNDVTARVQMEQRLMQLTEAQLYMLENMFPRHILERLARIASSDAVQPSSMLSLIKELSHVHTHHDCVTIMFTDIVGFTSMSKECEPQQVMAFLNQLFSKFDELVKKHKVSKVETAGDCYIVAAGLLDEDADGFHTLAVEDSDGGQATSRTQSARRVLNFATEMMHVARTVMMPHNGKAVEQRVGVHSGPVVSGLIGQLLPKFALFGDTMNTASRMESTSIPGRIQVSEFTYNLLRDESDSWECTGGVEVKGLGVMTTYLLSEAALQRTAPRHSPNRAAAAAAAAGRGYDSTRSSRSQHIPAYFQSSNPSSHAQQLSQSGASSVFSSRQFAWAPGELAHCLLAAMDNPFRQQGSPLSSLHSSQPRVQERLSRTMPRDSQHDVEQGLATTQPQEGLKLVTRASVPVAASYRGGEEERDRDRGTEEGGGVAVGFTRHASQPFSP